ncbi:MAG TPA: hypothetical protein VLG27_01280 [Candidatus Saccharimonadia bacterium]|nr:hypothetical protein [Candidatus Saccharimonadia bacterium]
MSNYTQFSPEKSPGQTDKVLERRATVGRAYPMLENARRYYTLPTNPAATNAAGAESVRMALNSSEANAVYAPNIPPTNPVIETPAVSNETDPNLGVEAIAPVDSTSDLAQIRTSVLRAYE